MCSIAIVLTNAYEERGVGSSAERTLGPVKPVRWSAVGPPPSPRAHLSLPSAMWGRSSPPPLLLLLLLLPLPSALGQFEEEEKPYRGQLVGSLNSYHHQVSLGATCSTSQLQTLLLNILS